MVSKWTGARGIESRQDFMKKPQPPGINPEVLGRLMLVLLASASTLKGVQINQNGPKGLFFENPRRGWFLDSPFGERHGKFYRLAEMSSFILNLNRQPVGEEILEFVAPGDQSV